MPSRSRRVLKRFLLAATVLVSIAAVFVVAIMVLVPSDYERGRRDATRDVQNGHYIKMTYGYLSVNSMLSDDSARKHHPEAEVRSFGCVVDKARVDYIHGYNSYSLTAARSHFGRDVFE